MHAEIGRNTLNSQLLPSPEVIQRFQLLLAEQPGYRGYVAIEAGDAQRVFLRLWDSAAAAKAGSNAAAVRTFREKYIAPAVTLQEILGQGPVIHCDFSGIPTP